MKNAISRLWDFLFPAECLECGTENFFLCPDCTGKIPFSFQKIHPDFLESLFILTDYHQPIVQKIIENLKFYHGKGIAHDLHPFLKKSTLHFSVPQNAVFVPVPLHFLRKNIRGYNQSLLLANEFSKIFGNPVQEILKRNRRTTPQSHLGKADRETNLIDAFITQKNTKKIPKDTPLFLIDDVGTTLSTLRECTKALRIFGFSSVSAIVLARSQT